MDPAALQTLLGNLPGGGVAIVAIWFALRKDGQCTALMDKLTDIVVKQAVTNEQLTSSLDKLREAIPLGTKP